MCENAQVKCSPSTLIKHRPEPLPQESLSADTLFGKKFGHPNKKGDNQRSVHIAARELVTKYLSADLPPRSGDNFVLRPAACPRAFWLLNPRRCPDTEEILPTFCATEDSCIGSTGPPLWPHATMLASDHQTACGSLRPVSQ